MYYVCAPHAYLVSKKATVALDSLELELMVKNHLMGAENKHGTSGTAAVACNCWAISPAPKNKISGANILNNFSNLYI